MSDNLDLREQITRIDRMREEALKFTAEQHKLMAEESKLAAERIKLDRDRWWSPALAIVGLIGGLVAVATLILHAIGHGS